MENYNLLGHGVKEGDEEAHLHIGHYLLKIAKDESKLFGVDPDKLAVDEQDLWKARANYLARSVGFTVTAIPKNEDGQTHGILCADRRDPSHILGIFVQPWLRSQGIGKALIEDFARRHPATEIKVSVLKRNVRALRFYESLGFAFIDSHELITELVGIRSA